MPASAQAYHVGDSQWQTREPTETGRVTLLSVAGRLGSVVKGSARSPAAASLLVRLSSAEWSKDVSPRSPATTLYRSSQIPQAKTWTGLTALDEAVHAAIRGDRLPAECLTEAANQWRKITQDLGIENQRRAYWRSLGKTPP
ncbi:MAG: hypothetical protein MUF25_28790 [Pirellulaceae bacterium]|nr:hypothetical protein [Pirellulaceae bacterium]